MPTLIEEALEDFPKSEIWRLQTDGWMSTLGPANFRPQFYKGMDAGFEYLKKIDRSHITPELIEGIYHSAYGFEDEYENEAVLRRGYCDTSNGFEIFLPYPGLEHDAGVSLEGIDELIKMLKDSSDAQTGKYPQIGLKITLNEKYVELPYIRPDIKNYENLATFKEEIIGYLKRASGSKEKCTGQRTEEKDLARVSLFSYAAKREDVIRFVQADIDKYYANLKAAENEINPIHAKMNAINQFIRKLHQSHYFPDGNGRTFIFLLANLLFLQNDFGMKITEYPSHYGGYSTNELLLESVAGLVQFNEYKITKARDYLENLDIAGLINEGKFQKVKTDLVERLSRDPLIAMAQLNELFVRINNNSIIVPKGYISPTWYPSTWSYSSFFSTPNDRVTHQNSLRLLKTLYIEKLHELVENQPHIDETKRIGYGTIADEVKMNNSTSITNDPATILNTMIKRHEISNECLVSVENELEKLSKFSQMKIIIK